MHDGSCFDKTAAQLCAYYCVLNFLHLTVVLELLRVLKLLLLCVQWSLSDINGGV